VQYRILGEAGPQVSAVGLGCMALSEFYGKADPVSCERTIRHAIDRGITLIDTASAYGALVHGEAANEMLVGRAIKGARSGVVLATKFGVVRRRGTRIVNNSPAYIRRSIDKSLARLRVDHIDIYYAHRHDPRVPIEDVIGTMAELVNRGKVRYLGLSEVSAETLRRASREHPITALQSEYSLISRNVEREVLPVARELGVGVVAYAPIGRGLLAGRLRSVERLYLKDLRRTHPRFRPRSLPHNLTLVDRLQAIAREVGCTPAQLALAWLLTNPAGVVPIPSTSKVRHLEENLAAVDVVLTEQQVSVLDSAFRPDDVIGARNTPAALALME
jgi:aryl-alcohol dehydrogenase-like predicted oxidoreductase